MRWTHRGGHDWCAITLDTADGPLLIYSIYSPTESETLWISPIDTILATGPPRPRSVLVRDFILYHPS